MGSSRATNRGTPDTHLITIPGKRVPAVPLHHYNARFQGHVLFTLLIVVLTVRGAEQHEYTALKPREQFSFLIFKESQALKGCEKTIIKLPLNMFNGTTC